MFSKYFSRTATPVASSAGGDCWPVDDWTRLDRFLILGSECGTYYVGERELTRANAEAVARCIAADGLRVLDRIVAISDTGRAPKNDPATFSLAMAAKLGDEPTRRAAYAALPKVCRTGAQLMRFAEYAQSFGGWGRGMRRAIAAWFNAKPATELADQLAKYQSRDGWSQRDLLRLAHPRAASPSHDRLFAWTVTGELSRESENDPALALPVAMRELRALTEAKDVAKLVADRKIPRECIPSEWLKHAAVWEALLPAMPMTALIRNLATMTRVGLVTQASLATHTLVDTLRDPRVHPLALLGALATYQQGHGVRGTGSWVPVASILDALDAAFYASFGHVVPTNQRMLLALDVSGSMSSGTVAGMPDVSPRLASAAMALITAATERDHGFVGFSTNLIELAISPHQRLDEVCAATEKLPFGGTDCAQPVLWAQKHRVDVDTFVIYTDNETRAGSVHPAQALRAYRDARGIPAKLVVVGMTSSGFSVADPDDAGMVDVVGFDASAPPVIADFARA